MDLTPGPGRRTRIRTIGAAALTLALATGTSAALAGGGGIGTPDPPAVTDARCVEGCLDLRTVAEGGRAELVGRDLSAVTGVRLAGAAAIPVRRAEAGSVEFVIPEGAETGKPVAIDAYGNKSRSPVELEIGSGNR